IWRYRNIYRTRRRYSAVGGVADRARAGSWYCQSRAAIASRAQSPTSQRKRTARMSASLRDIQRTLQNYLLDRGGDMAGLIVQTPSAPRAVRLGIYANAYRARIVEAVAVDYPCLRKYLGQQQFTALVHAYLTAHPSRHFSIRWLGDGLCDFMQATAPYREHRDVCDLTLFERALSRAFDAEDIKPLDATSLANLSPQQWAGLKLTFAPSLQVLQLHTNAPQLWKALQAEAQPDPVPVQAQAWLVWRQGLRLMFRPAQILEVLALNLFRQGETFTEVCVRLAEHLPEQQVAPHAVGLLQQWLREEWVA